MREGRRRPAWTGLALVALMIAVALVTQGHVGSPDVYFEGQAGPWPVRVVLRPPRVIPGQAEVNVRLLSPAPPGALPSRVAVQPVVWNAGPEGVPPADLAQPVPGAPGQWSAQLWLMRSTSYSVRVEVSGAAGSGVVSVPVAAVASERLPMRRGLAVVLSALGTFLLVGGLTAIGAAVRESSLPPGEEPGPRRRRQARWAVAGAAVLLGLALWGGRVWWRNVDAAYRRAMYRPLHVTAAARAIGADRRLTLKIDDPAWHGPDRVPLMPDHGKLMHLFLIREPQADAFAHLHPLPDGKSDDTFEVALPPLPAGGYRLFVDITHENGFAETLATQVAVPPPGATPPAAGEPALASDPDDSFRAGSGASEPGSTSFVGDGYALAWEGAPGRRRVGRDAGLRFTLRGPDGKPAPIEPYMGMLSHAAIVRDDGQVFIHLHPDGTVSMAARQVFDRREKPAPAGMPEMPGMPGMAHSAEPPAGTGTLAFPWTFPQPGRYHLWVQVKSGGQVRTGVFAVEVTAA